jgi:hypothetical protein
MAAGEVEDVALARGDKIVGREGGNRGPAAHDETDCALSLRTNRTGVPAASMIAQISCDQPTLRCLVVSPWPYRWREMHRIGFRRGAARWPSRTAFGVGSCQARVMRSCQTAERSDKIS